MANQGPIAVTETAFEQAVGWRLREGELDAAGWAAYADWIDADPAHGAAVRRLDALDGHLGSVNFGQPYRPARWFARPMTRWAGGGGAIAAAIAAIVFVSAPQAVSVVEISTQPGELRTIALNDGSSVTLNGGTRIRMDAGSKRSVELASGEAVFNVRHDAAHPFQVRAGNYVIEDAGTVFNVARLGNQLTVGVASGSVVFQPSREAILLKAGAELQVDGTQGSATTRAVPADSVAGWRTGLLSFNGAPLKSVAGAIERRSGTRITLAAGLMDRPFTGSVRLSGEADRDVPHLASLIGANARRDGNEWTVEAMSAR